MAVVRVHAYESMSAWQYVPRFSFPREAALTLSSEAVHTVLHNLHLLTGPPTTATVALTATTAATTTTEAALFFSAGTRKRSVEAALSLLVRWSLLHQPGHIERRGKGSTRTTTRLQHATTPTVATTTAAPTAAATPMRCEAIPSAKLSCRA
jgi:hypothetical protein